MYNIKTMKSFFTLYYIKIVLPSSLLHGQSQAILELSVKLFSWRKTFFNTFEKISNQFLTEKIVLNYINNFKLYK